MNEFHLWASYGAQIRRLDLTTAVGGDASKMQIHFKRLIRWINRKYKGYIDYIGVQTTEGNGVIHVFVAWVGKKTFWIDQAELCVEWERIHGAKIAWITAIGRSGDVKTSVGYVAAQYVAGQAGGVRLFRTTRHRRINGEGVWRGFRASVGHTYWKVTMAQWRAYLGGEAVNLADGSIWQRDDVAEQGPPSSRVPIGLFIGDGERWRVPPG